MLLCAANGGESSAADSATEEMAEEMGESGFIDWLSAVLPPPPPQRDVGLIRGFHTDDAASKF